MLRPDIYEEQATACLLAAEQHRAALIGGAKILAGSDEAGRELFQEACLRCHETIQRHGFHGEGYQFYLWRVIKNLNQEVKEHQRRALPLPELEHLEPSLEQDERLHLANQISFELSARFPAADVALFQLHVNGQSYRDIEQLTGRNYRTIGHIVKNIKDSLRGLFGSSFEALQ